MSTDLASGAGRTGGAVASTGGGAQADGLLVDEIIPVTVTSRKGSKRFRSMNTAG